MKKFFTALIAAIAVMTLMPVLSVKADDTTGTISAKVLNRNEKIAYHVFNEPSDIAYSDSGLYIRTSLGYELFDGKTFTKSDVLADSVAILSGGIATLSQGKLTYGGTELGGDFTLISAYKNSLYAASGNTIRSFNCENGEVVEQTPIEAPAPVNLLAATDSGCMYAVSRAGYTDIYIGSELLTSQRDRVLSLAFAEGNPDGKYYILTSAKIIMYVGFYSIPIEKSVTEGAISMTAGDGIYILTVTGTIVKYRPDLSGFEPLAASSGEFDWFYEMPAGVDTKLQNIYVPDKSLGRVAIISNNGVSYLGDLNSPVAATTDNRGNVYVAHNKNKVKIFNGSVAIDELEIHNNKPGADEQSGSGHIVDIVLDTSGNMYCLMRNGDVISDGKVIKENVKAMEFLSTMHYMTDEYVKDVPLSATDFALDVMGNIFAVSGNKVIAVVDGETNEYTIENAGNLTAIAISKVDSGVISYGDLIMVDQTNMCVLTIDGEQVGSVNAKNLFTPPALNSTPNPQADGIVGLTEGAIIFTLPVEGEIAYEAKSGERIILLKEGSAPDPFVYCAIDTVGEDGKHKLITGYAYKYTVDILNYEQPRCGEAKINVDNTPVYKYPSVNSPKIGEYNRNTTVSILPFAVTTPDEFDNSNEPQNVWYTDAYNYKWYRISYGKNEGFIIASAANVQFFSNEIDMPQFNATITEDTKLYRYDEASDSYIEFESLGEIQKDTRVRVENTYDTSVKYTKVIFYRDGYGVIETDCYVETKYVEFDGVDIVKIVAICVIILAVIILIIVIIRRYKIRRLNRSHAPEFDNRQ